VTVWREFWRSQQLVINLLSIRSDPRIGKQVFTVTEISLGDPEPALFELPAGYKVVERRQSAPPESQLIQFCRRGKHPCTQERQLGSRP
jgi:hypothetical protein